MPSRSDDLLPHRETEVIRIDRERHAFAAAMRAHHVGMALDRVEIGLLRQEIRLAQQPRVPVRGPALVHDLGGEHGIEIERLLAHGEEDVALPAFEVGRVVGDEPQQVALGMRRYRARFWRNAVRSTPAGGGSSEAKRLRNMSSVARSWAPDTRDKRSRCSAGSRSMCCSSASAASSTASTRWHAVFLDRAPDLPRVVRGMLDDVLAHLLLAAPEHHVVAREIRVPEHVRGHQHVLGERRCSTRGRRARDCPERPPRTGASGPCGAGSAGRCSARRTTSAACVPAARRRRFPS